MRPRGHSNVCSLNEMKPYPTNPDRWSIPIQGGSSVNSVKDFPDLALSKDEWMEIGKRAEWLPSNKELETLVLERFTVGEVYYLWQLSYKKSYGELPTKNNRPVR